MRDASAWFEQLELFSHFELSSGYIVPLNFDFSFIKRRGNWKAEDYNGLSVRCPNIRVNNLYFTFLNTDKAKVRVTFVKYGRRSPQTAAQMDAVLKSGESVISLPLSDAATLPKQ